jgi:hypothetical protein
LVGTTLSIDLSAYAPLASPALTGNPTAPTPTAGDNDTSIATTAFVVTKAANYLPLAGGTLAGNLTISSAGALVLQSTTASTSPTTGALTVAGGLGIGGNIYGGEITSIRSTPANGIYYFGNAANKWLEYYSAASRFYLTGAPLTIQDATASSSPTTGALTVAGGLGVGGAVNVGGNINAADYIVTSATIAGNHGLTVENKSAASNASAAVIFKNNAALLSYIFMGSSTYSGFGGTNALNLLTDAATPIAFSTNGAFCGQVHPGGSLVWGNPTSGGNGGPGSINAQAVYDDGVVLTCFGVEYLKYGKVDVAEWDKLSPNGEHEPARKFAAMVKEFDPRDPRAYIKRMLADEALPGMPTKDEWRHNTLSLGEMHNRLWLAVELLATAFAGALDQIEMLEKRQRGTPT